MLKPKVDATLSAAAVLAGAVLGVATTAKPAEATCYFGGGCASCTMHACETAVGRPNCTGCFGHCITDYGPCVDC
jgi:hypothetical protein